MTTGVSILIGIFAFLAILFFFLLIAALIHRLAIRVVAGFYPSVWMVILCLIVGTIAWIVVEGAVMIFARASLTPNELAGANSLVGLAVMSGIFGALIKYPDGNLLGFWRGLISYILAGVFSFIIGLVIVLGFVAVIGKKPIADAWQKEKVAMAQMTAMQASKNPQSIAFPWGNLKLPIPSPTPDPLAAATPTSDTIEPGSRLYLKEPITIHVAYGNMIIPAKAPVTFIDQTGDSCRVQFNNNVYTITRDNLTTQP
jgi:hypothetical protein